MDCIRFSHLCACLDSLETRANGGSPAQERMPLVLNGVTKRPEEVVALWEAHIAREVLNRARGGRFRILCRLDLVDEKWVPHFFEVTEGSMDVVFA